MLCFRSRSECDNSLTNRGNPLTTLVLKETHLRGQNSGFSRRGCEPQIFCKQPRFNTLTLQRPPMFL